MVFDPEKAGLEANNQDVVSSQQEESISRDEDSKKEQTDEDSLHSRASSLQIEEGDPVAEEGQVPRSKSRASSTHSRALSIVPRSQRRGLLARLAVIPETNRPYDYPNKTKWLITLIVAIAAAAAPLGSAIFFRKS